MMSDAEKVDVLEQKIRRELDSLAKLLGNQALQNSPNAEQFAKVDSNLSSAIGLFASKSKPEQATESTEKLDAIMQHKQDQVAKTEFKQGS